MLHIQLIGQNVQSHEDNSTRLLTLPFWKRTSKKERHNVSINQSKGNHPLLCPSPSQIPSFPPSIPGPRFHYNPYTHTPSDVQAKDGSLSLSRTSNNSFSYCSTNPSHSVLSFFGKPEQASDTPLKICSSLGCWSDGRALTEALTTCLQTSHSRSRLWNNDAVYG